ncbi:Peptidase_M24 domain-containing protein/Creatinase_N domain-containing protein [Prunus yedoensis var. nudiflora]|uniref:Peptidase_M24 domain-containing protein/Creatinase_N domain-containing protein n=1 Tax=Prunus yedoensis var. nudiflora TaxID=2094558 RepID=A0A314YB51_PRUYE|nr:Peptidase_M24 domain-containing protein/Creatinase_N domain-containing protein [Prunus yedoensis var. nudiflora]
MPIRPSSSIALSNWVCCRVGTNSGAWAFNGLNETFQDRDGSDVESNEEPGYYEDGNFGIRLENVLIINEADTKFNFGGKGYLQFEHITWAPYQRKLIDLSLLAPEELDFSAFFFLIGIGFCCSAAESTPQRDRNGV